MGVPKLGRIVAATAMLRLATGQKDMAKCAPVFATSHHPKFSLPLSLHPYFCSRPISVV
ncbi:hypothetical protein M5D96_005086, partial [Drosophila gunungcola]